MKSSVRFFAFSAFLLSLFMLTCQAQDWPQWRGVNRDGKVTGFSVPQTWQQQLKQIWKISVGPGDATPALVNGRLYVFTRLGDNEVLQCLDATNGKQIWQSAGYPAIVVSGPPASHPGPRSSVSVSDGMIVTVGVGGDIACFNATSGKLLWRNEEYKGKVPRFYTGMSPLISSGVCYVALGGPNAGAFIAFDLATSAVKWKTEGEGPSYASPALMTIDGSKQIIFQAQTKLVGLNITDGKQMWEYATPVGSGMVQIATTPVTDQNKVYFTGLNNGVNAIEIKKAGNTFTVNKLWTNPDLSTSYNTPVVKDGFLYGLSNKGRLFCINVANGQTAWTDETAYQNFGSIIDAGSVMVALSSNGNFIVYKPDGTKFTRLAQIKVSDNTIYAHPVLSGKWIFIKDSDSLICFSTE